MDMNITDLGLGERGIVLAVDCEQSVKERLRALNIRSGGVVRILKVSFFKKTYLLQAGVSRVALRREVAACVTVRKA